MKIKLKSSILIDLVLAFIITALQSYFMFNVFKHNPSSFTNIVNKLPSQLADILIYDVFLILCVVLLYVLNISKIVSVITSTILIFIYMPALFEEDVFKSEAETAKAMFSVFISLAIGFAAIIQKLLNRNGCYVVGVRNAPFPITKNNTKNWY